MIPESHITLLNKLKEVYGHDQQGMATLANIERSPKIINQYRVLRDNPIVIKIAEEAYAKVKQAYAKLSSESAWNMTEGERAFHLSTIAWGEWFLTSLGEDPDVQENRVYENIENLAKRAGIVPKE